jgi:hypothetical protein
MFYVSVKKFILLMILKKIITAQLNIDYQMVNLLIKVEIKLLDLIPILLIYQNKKEKIL